MSKSIRLAAASVATALGLIAGTAAHAAQPGLYVGGQIGAAKQDVDAAGLSSRSRPAIVGAALGYNVNSNFGVEADLRHLGRAKFGDGSRARTDLLGVNLVGHLPVTQALDVYGKVGVAHASRTLKDANGDSIHKSGLARSVGVGLEYALTPTTSLTAGIDRYTGAPTLQAAGGSVYKGSFTSYMVGVNHHF